MSIEVMKSTFECAKRNERHDKVSETRYWCDQYRMLADWAIKLLERQAIAEAEKRTLSSKVNDARVHAERDKQRDSAMKLLTESKKQEPYAYTYMGIKADDSQHGPHLCWKPEYMDVMSHSKGAIAIPLYTYPQPKRKPLAKEFGITSAIDIGLCSLQIVFKSRQHADAFKQAHNL